MDSQLNVSKRMGLVRRSRLLQLWLPQRVYLVAIPILPYPTPTSHLLPIHNDASGFAPTHLNHHNLLHHTSQQAKK